MQASIRLLLRRINIIPSSLVLAQAANESAWGTSRFAIEANNYFGQWCYREGCGLVPTERDEGLSHEVKNFNSVVDSVKSYLHMLNSGKAYALLRNLRQQRLEEEKPLTGYELAAGLAKYSERGTAYVASIRSLIVANHLQHYSDALYVSLAGGRSQQAF
jgi:Bax protein